MHFFLPKQDNCHWQSPIINTHGGVCVYKSHSRCSFIILRVFRAVLPQPHSLNAAGDLAVMDVLSPGLIFSGRDSAGAKLIETTEAEGCGFGGAPEGKDKGERSGCWGFGLVILRWNDPTFSEQCGFRRFRLYCQAVLIGAFCQRLKEHSSFVFWLVSSADTCIMTTIWQQKHNQRDSDRL